MKRNRVFEILVLAIFIIFSCNSQKKPHLNKFGCVGFDVNQLKLNKTQRHKIDRYLQENFHPVPKINDLCFHPVVTDNEKLQTIGLYQFKKDVHTNVNIYFFRYEKDLVIVDKSNKDMFTKEVEIFISIYELELSDTTKEKLRNL